jgi:hypothetical protein
LLRVLLLIGAPGERELEGSAFVSPIDTIGEQSGLRLLNALVSSGQSGFVLGASAIPLRPLEE